jgi:hypothetical protein
MSKRIEHELREKIQKDKRSVMVIAKERGISPGTVQLWKKRDSVFDQSRDPTVCPEMDNFEEIIFLEMLRLSRYHHGKLMRYLAPISTRLPSQETPLSGRSKAVAHSEPDQTKRKSVISSTVLRRIKRYASGSLLSACDDKISGSGKVGIHKIQILWSTSDGKSEKSEVVLLMERTTGLLYARAYKRVRLGEVKKCMSRFEKMYGYDILSMHFVTASDFRVDAADVISRSTVLNYLRSKKDSSFLRDSAKDELIDERGGEFQVRADADTPYQARRAIIPGTFKNLEAVNRALSRLVNKINLTPRHYYDKGSRKGLTPLSNLIEYNHSEHGKLVFVTNLTNQIKLTRK